MNRNLMLHYIIALSCLLSAECSSQTMKNFSYDAEQLLKFSLSPFMIFNNIYPDTSHFSKLPAQEIILALNEEFKVELNHCSIHEQWIYSIEDSVMKLIQCDTMVTDTLASLSYKFCASQACKGCIVFYNTTYGSSRELIVEYTCDPVDSLELILKHQDWFVDTTSPTSDLLIHLSGQTNAPKLKVESYGDGILSAVIVYPKNDGSFSDTVDVAFSYDPMHQHIPVSNTRIALYGAIGFPKISTILYNRLTSVNEKNDRQVLKRFILNQNYPNPFNPSTTISFSLPLKSFVTLKIFDFLGREIATLANEELSAGDYSRQWNALDISSGIYFYRLQAGSIIETKKLILLR